MNKSHARIRAQQRGIRPFIEQLLDQFGEETYDGRGGVIRHFSHASRQAMEQELASASGRKLSGLLNVYKVENSRSGRVITVGHQTKRINRK